MNPGLVIFWHDAETPLFLCLDCAAECEPDWCAGDDGPLLKPAVLERASAELRRHVAHGGGCEWCTERWTLAEGGATNERNRRQAASSPATRD